MLGPPGAGKGTQAERFARARGIPRISTGDILREAVHDGTVIGRNAVAVMARGGLVSDEVMIGIVTDRLQEPDAQHGFVLDGFPRTVAQAVALDGLMAGRDPLVVVDIVVPEAELVRRLASRMICGECGVNATGATGAAGPRAIDGPDAPAGVCRQCGGRLVQRADDCEAVVLERLKVYQRATEPLVDFYRGRPTFRAIDGAQPADRVAADLVAAVEAVGSRPLHAAAGGGAR